jgi:hypothetical protein
MIVVESRLHLGQEISFQKTINLIPCLVHDTVNAKVNAKVRPGAYHAPLPAQT